MPRKKLSKAELFFIRQYMASKKPEDIAADLNMSVAAVKRQIEEFTVEDRTKAAADEAPKKTKNPLDKTKFAVGEGTVSMTPAQVAYDDDHKHESDNILNNPRYKGCIGKIYKD